MFVIADPLTTTDAEVGGAVASGDRRWLEVRARALAAAGADAIDVNASSMGSAEADVLLWMAEVVEAVTDLPLSLDGPDPAALLRCARGRRAPVVLNSWPADAVFDETLVDVLQRPGSRLVVQLRHGRTLPAGAEDRRAWAEDAVERFARAGLDPSSLLIDAVALPWGTDVAAGRGLLEFVAAWAHDHPEIPTLVGLGNVGHGAADPAEARRTWLELLAAAGLGAVLLDPRDRTLTPFRTR